MEQTIAISGEAEFERLLRAVAENMRHRLRDKKAVPGSQGTDIAERLSGRQGEQNGNSE